MGQWKNDRPACVMTWSTLALLGEHSTPFPSAGGIKMTQLMFWAGSTTGRAARARALAVQIDSTFRDLFGSKYEKSVTKTKAIMDMTNALLVAKNTLLDFADVNDGLYLFLGEK